MSKNKIEKVCIGCSKRFYASAKKVRYCSIRCARTKKFSKAEKEKIISLYKGGIGARKIAGDFKCSTDTILSFLRRNGIETRKVSEANKIYGNSNRVYSVNDNFFEYINDENKAYWLGFIVADGNVNRTSNLFSVALCGEDIGHLKKFKKDIMSDHKIREFVNSTGNSMAGLYITSQKIKSDLEKLGITPNKRYTVMLPKIDDRLYRHFWRGVIDGDGSIIKRQRKNTFEWTIKLTGTHNIVNSFSIFVKENLGFDDRKNFKDGKSFCVQYQGSFVPISVIKLLYQDASIYLDRKMELAKGAMGSDIKIGSRYRNIIKAFK